MNTTDKASKIIKGRKGMGSLRERVRELNPIQLQNFYTHFTFKELLNLRKIIDNAIKKNKDKEIGQLKKQIEEIESI